MSLEQAAEKFEPALRTAGARSVLFGEQLFALVDALDGAGPLRTVSPTLVVRRWAGRADKESASLLGKATGFERRDGRF